MGRRFVGTAWLIVCLGVAVENVGSSATRCAAAGPSGDDVITLYVTRDGDDANDGRTRETAFAGIQHAVDVLQPGQTLVIGPGEYFGPVVADHLGHMDADTVIRAEIPGTVVLRGDVPAPTFQPVPGYRRVHVADFVSDRDIQIMNELDTLRVLSRVPNVAELEYTPGRFHQDRAAGRLYVSSSDTQPVDRHCYTLTMIGTHGLYLDTPRRVRVEGLTVTGFNSTVGLPYGQQTLG